MRLSTIKKQKKKSIEISFVDEYAAENVTGSLVYIQIPHHKLLLDAGFVQSNDIEDDYRKNTRNFKKFKIKEIDHLFLKHHIYIKEVVKQQQLFLKKVLQY